jgi:hypothetical protein
METIETIENRNTVAISKLKNDIKTLSNTQRELKNQMKTVNLIGERTMTPDVAQYKHWGNRRKLILMYAAYQILRGKEVIKPKTLGDDFGRWFFYTDQAIQKIVDEYSKK